MKLLTVIASVLVLPLEMFSQSYLGGGGPNAFYQIPMSPREVAMGGIGTASAVGAFAPYFNPARALAFTEDNDSSSFSIGVISQSGSMNNTVEALYKKKVSTSSHRAQIGFIVGLGNPLPLIRHEFDSIMTRLVVGLSYQDRSVPDIYATHLLYDEIILDRSFEAKEGILLLTVAFQNFLSSGIDFGYNYRRSYTNYSLENGQTWYNSGSDIGISVALSDSWTCGTMIRMLKDERNRELLYCFGLSWKFPIKSSNTPYIRMSMGFSSGSFDPFRFVLGVEIPWSPVDNVTLLGRGGLRFNRNTNPNGNGLIYNSACLGIGIRTEIKRGKYLLINFSYQAYYNDDGEYLELVDSPLKIGIEYTL